LGPCSITYCKFYPTQVNCTSPIWLVCEKESISHLRISYAIYVPVSPYQRTPKKPHQKLGCMSLWLGIFMRLGTLIAFPSIRGREASRRIPGNCMKRNKGIPSTHTSKSRPEVQKSMHLQITVNELPNAFTD